MADQMKITKITKFQTPDGMEFDTELEAQYHIDQGIVIDELKARMKRSAPDSFDYGAVAEWLVENYEITVRR